MEAYARVVLVDESFEKYAGGADITAELDNTPGYVLNKYLFELPKYYI